MELTYNALGKVLSKTDARGITTAMDEKTYLSSAGVATTVAAVSEAVQGAQ